MAPLFLLIGMHTYKVWSMLVLLLLSLLLLLLSKMFGNRVTPQAPLYLYLGISRTAVHRRRGHITSHWSLALRCGFFKWTMEFLEFVCCEHLYERCIHIHANEQPIPSRNFQLGWLISVEFGKLGCSVLNLAEVTMLIEMAWRCTCRAY